MFVPRRLARGSKTVHPAGADEALTNVDPERLGLDVSTELSIKLPPTIAVRTPLDPPARASRICDPHSPLTQARPRLPAPAHARPHPTTPDHARPRRTASNTSRHRRPSSPLTSPCGSITRWTPPQRRPASSLSPTATVAGPLATASRRHASAACGRAFMGRGVSLCADTTAPLFRARGTRAGCAHRASYRGPGCRALGELGARGARGPCT